MKRQKSKNQLGEINFRKKLVQQQLEGKSVLKDEFDSKEIEQILEKRMQKTLNQMRFLRNSGIKLSPYIEIGAERGQRSLVMENELNSNGAAVDISFDMLKSCAYYKNQFKKDNLPLRICCDANQLPFASNSLPFIFCYETLHHFPTPLPVINEIYRVLSPGGSFFFDEEPFKRILRLEFVA